uniref:LIM zinc-binding domain-containing protein n=1 Tax=Wuchereria bancrofti TaxID=6293 RepID=A0A1I8E9Y7_WUCBA
MDKSFHVHCYRCEDCNMQLNSKIEGQGCYPLDQHLYCKNCNGKIKYKKSWSSEIEMSYQKNNYASQLLLLNQQYYDKNDTLSIANTGNIDNEIPLSVCHSDTTKDDSDSDEEFAVHACLRGLIKSKSMKKFMLIIHLYIMVNV